MRPQETATSEFVSSLESIFTWPMEWREASARHSNSPSAAVGGRRKPPVSVKS
jgi:hypothetical protein